MCCWRITTGLAVCAARGWLLSGYCDTATAHGAVCVRNRASCLHDNAVDVPCRVLLWAGGWSELFASVMQRAGVRKGGKVAVVND